MSQRFSKGFTLIELLVVISIIGMLSSIVLSSLNSARLKARDSARLAQMNAVQKALDLYYSNNNQYPPNTAAVLDVSDNIPLNWAGMIQALNTDGVIKASVSSLDQSSSQPIFSDFIPTAFASMAPGNYFASIQDPLYKARTDYLYSFGYVSYNNQQNYKVRVYLENGSNSVFNTSLTGTFLDAATTGNSACDKNANYYCAGR